MKKSLLFTFYLFYFTAAVFSSPYVIFYLQGLGFNGTQVAFLAGLTPIVTMLSAPLWTRFADATYRHRQMMNVTIILSIILSALFPFLHSFIIVTIISVLFIFFVSPILPLADSATLGMLGSEKALYGRVRLGGTIGWGVTAILAGYIIQTYGIKWAFWGFSMIMVAVLIISQKFTFTVKVESEPPPRDLRKSFANRRWVIFFILAVIAGVGFTLMTNFLSPYLSELKISQSVMGIALSIATLSELPVLYYSNRLIKYFGTFKLLMLALALTGVRMLLFAWVNSVAGILVFQLLNGLTFPLFWVAAVSYSNEISPEGMKATGQGLLSAFVFGIGSAVGGVIGGLMMGSIGGSAMYLSIGLVILLSAIVLMLLARSRRTQQAMPAAR